MMPPIPTEQEQNAGFLLGNAIEELRDLVTAVEWLVEADPAGPTYAAEKRRVKIRLESAKALIGKSDTEH